MAKCECRGCTKRQIGCHATCESYLAFKKEVEEINKRIRLENQANYEDNFLAKARWRKIRRKA